MTADKKQNKTTPKRRPATRKAKPQSKAKAIKAPVAETPSNVKWHRIDLHMHTPASHDYEQPEYGYLDILKKAEQRGLSMIAFTDHNTANGYRKMQREIEDLKLLEKLERIKPEEQGKLNEFRRLLAKIVVLPGFEFTATFGFHILGVFPQDKPLREIENVLVQLRVPNQVIEDGLTEAGATSDVLNAYRLINEAGGIAIAAHANSTNGVSMRGKDLGGQTRIAFTQDPNLAAIEFTDLDRGKRSSSTLFTAIRNEYPRRMHALQGSDAHRVFISKENPKRLGVGDRVTEVQLEKIGFDELKALLKSDGWDKVRPVFDQLDVANVTQADAESGESKTRAYHIAFGKKANDRFDAILADLCAMANIGGGKVIIGWDGKIKKKPVGVKKAVEVMRELSDVIAQKIYPHASVASKVENVQGAEIISIDVAASANAPYIVGNQFFVRDDKGTRAATRDEIVAISRASVAVATAPVPVEHTRQHQPQRRAQNAQNTESHSHDRSRASQQRQPMRDENRAPSHPNKPPQNVPAEKQLPSNRTEESAAKEAPQRPAAPSLPPIEVASGTLPNSGVEIASVEEREGIRYYTVRDMRNNALVRNVTIRSARDLWHYAIVQTNKGAYDNYAFEWQDDRAVLNRSDRSGRVRYDLAVRDVHGKPHIIFGVLTEGLDESWRDMLMDFDAQIGVQESSSPVAKPAAINANDSDYR